MRPNARGPSATRGPYEHRAGVSVKRPSLSEKNPKQHEVKIMCREVSNGNRNIGNQCCLFGAHIPLPSGGFSLCPMHAASFPRQPPPLSSPLAFSPGLGCWHLSRSRCTVFSGIGDDLSTQGNLKSQGCLIRWVSSDRVSLSQTLYFHRKRWGRLIHPALSYARKCGRWGLSEKTAASLCVMAGPQG